MRAYRQSVTIRAILSHVFAVYYLTTTILVTTNFGIKNILNIQNLYLKYKMHLHTQGRF